jgi:hypothetical protein
MEGRMFEKKSPYSPNLKKSTIVHIAKAAQTPKKT